MAIFFESRLIDKVDWLSEEESRHCASVLRHQVGDEITIMDGKGIVSTCRLTSVGKKRCEFELISQHMAPSKPFSIHLAISPTKNSDRMEWLVEKLQEIGVDEVTFIKTEHSERGKIRIDRLEKKAISAMKQSTYPFLIKINEITSFQNFINKTNTSRKWIAHVGNHKYFGQMISMNQACTILIGPEGDFSLHEVELAKKHGFVPVSLGRTTLRTETAGFVACHLLNVVNEF